MAVDVRTLPKLLNNPKHTVEPLWASDTGRFSNSGKFSGTFIGFFDNVELSFGKTTQEEMTQIKNALEVPIIEDASFTDSNTGNTKTEDFYGTAITAERLNRYLYKPFTIKLIAVEKR